MTVMKNAYRLFLNSFVTVFAPISIAVSLTVSLTGCAALGEKIVEKPNVDLEKVTVDEVNLTGATLRFAIKVANPNSFPLKVDALKYNVDLSGKPFTTGKIDHELSVPGKQSKTIEIPVPVKYTEIFSTVMGIVKNEPSTYRVRGEALFGVFSIPFDKTGEVKIRK